MSITVKRQYCEQHMAKDHYCDENYHCHGATLIDVERKGYTYARHIGDGWYKLQEKYNPCQQQDLAWEMAAEAHDSAAALYYEPDFDF